MRALALRLVVTASALLYAYSVLLTAYYYNPANHLSYRSTVSVRDLPRAVGGVSTEALRKALQASDAYVGLLLCVAFIRAGRVPSQSNRLSPSFLFFSAQGILVPWGWLGLMMIAEAALTGIDGEWLAEGSAKSSAAGIWIIVALGIAVAVDRRAVRQGPNSIGRASACLPAG